MWALKILVALSFASCCLCGLFLFYLTYMNVAAVKTLSRQQMVHYIGDGLKLTATTIGVAFFWVLVLMGLYFTFWTPFLYGPAFVFILLLLVCSFTNSVVSASVFDNY